jgi:hypothetical protein
MLHRILSHEATGDCVGIRFTGAGGMSRRLPADRLVRSHRGAGGCRRLDEPGRPGSEQPSADGADQAERVSSVPIRSWCPSDDIRVAHSHLSHGSGVRSISSDSGNRKVVRGCALEGHHGCWLCRHHRSRQSEAARSDHDPNGWFNPAFGRGPLALLPLSSRHHRRLRLRT